MAPIDRPTSRLGPLAGMDTNKIHTATIDMTLKSVRNPGDGNVAKFIDGIRNGKLEIKRNPG